MGRDVAEAGGADAARRPPRRTALRRAGAAPRAGPGAGDATPTLLLADDVSSRARRRHRDRAVAGAAGARHRPSSAPRARRRRSRRPTGSWCSTPAAWSTTDRGTSSRRGGPTWPAEPPAATLAAWLGGDMRVVIAGASGFLGTHLSDHLRVHGHEVTALVRREPGSAHESCWDPAAGRIDAAVIESADAVVNLAGAPIAGNPHSKKWAREVLESPGLDHPAPRRDHRRDRAPAAFLAGNGIAWYGDHGDRRSPRTPPAPRRRVPHQRLPRLVGRGRPGPRGRRPRVRAADLAGDGPHRAAAEAAAPALPGRRRRPAGDGRAVHADDLAARLGRRGELPHRARDVSGAVQPLLPEHADQRRVHQGAGRPRCTARPSSPSRRPS